MKFNFRAVSSFLNGSRKKVVESSFFRALSPFLSPGQLAYILVVLILGGGFVGTTVGIASPMLGALASALCWALAAGLALISVLVLATGGYRRAPESERALVCICAGIGVMAFLLLQSYHVANLGPGELAIYKDKAVLVERPMRVVALEPPASVNLAEPLEIRILVRPINKQLIVGSLTKEDRAKVFVKGDTNGRNEEAKKVLADALGREVVRSIRGKSANGVSLEDALRLHGLALPRPIPWGLRG